LVSHLLNKREYYFSIPKMMYIAHIVMPPGHGKSHHHNKIPDLVEADTIYNYRGDAELSSLRTIARETGNWVKYDRQWADRILSRLIGNFWIVMVPSDIVGQLLGSTLLTKVQLTEHQWSENLKKRGKSTNDYDYAKLTGPDVHFFNTNVEVESHLQDVIRTWMSTLPVENHE